VSLFSRLFSQLFPQREIPLRVKLPTGAALACLACSHDLFVEQDAQVIFSGSMVGFMWKGRTVACRTCARCGYVHWFMRRRRAVEGLLESLPKPAP